VSDCDSLTHRSGVKLDWHVGFEGQSIFVGFDNASLGVPFTVLGVAEAADVLEMASDQIKIFYVVVVQDVFEPEVDDRASHCFCWSVRLKIPKVGSTRRVLLMRPHSDEADPVFVLLNYFNCRSSSELAVHNSLIHRTVLSTASIDEAKDTISAFRVVLMPIV